MSQCSNRSVFNYSVIRHFSYMYCSPWGGLWGGLPVPPNPLPLCHKEKRTNSKLLRHVSYVICHFETFMCCHCSTVTVAKAWLHWLFGIHRAALVRHQKTRQILIDELNKLQNGLAVGWSFIFILYNSGQWKREKNISQSVESFNLCLESDNMIK